MLPPWKCGPALPAGEYAAFVRRAMFEHCKWHTQVEGRPILTPYPLVVRGEAWREVQKLALALNREALRAEEELLSRSELHGRLGLPAPLRLALADAAKGPSPAGPRVTRIDFHWTPRGWRITEGNADVCGGWIEASGVTADLARHFPQHRTAGDPAAALSAAVRVGGAIAIVHMTVYTEDRQVALYLARRFGEAGLSAHPCAPEQLRWDGGRAFIRTASHEEEVGLVFRYFPAEWLPRLPTETCWQGHVTGGLTAVCNPALAVLTQSKRFPLTWDDLKAPLPTWRELLPEVRPHSGRVADEREWVVKPALGHEGIQVGAWGASGESEWEALWERARAAPDEWALQRRFELLPLETPDGPRFPCLGAYVIEGEAVGAYCRLAPRPLIDDRAQEMVVLIDDAE
jgi:glutathionylspermidine synthase